MKNFKMILKPKRITGSPLKHGGNATSAAGQSGMTTSPMPSGTHHRISRQPGSVMEGKARGGRIHTSMTTSGQCVMHGSET